jgi:hypothetical protein
MPPPFLRLLPPSASPTSRRCCACRTWPQNCPSDTASHGRGGMRWRRRRRRSTPRMGRTTNLSIPRQTMAQGTTGDAGAVTPRPSPPSPPSQCDQAMWCPPTWSRRIAARTFDRTSLRMSNWGAPPTTLLMSWTPPLLLLSLSSSTMLSYHMIPYSIHEAKYSKYDYFAYIRRKSIV